MFILPAHVQSVSMLVVYIQMILLCIYFRFLNTNSLSFLPARIFQGLTKLQTLYVHVYYFFPLYICLEWRFVDLLLSYTSLSKLGSLLVRADQIPIYEWSLALVRFERRT